MLHRAAGDRSEYASLGQALAERGIASLALDLRGHGESANLGRFEEPYAENRYINQGAYSDIGAGLDWLARRNEVDGSRLAVVAASYSGEQAGIAFRQDTRQAAAYVMLSPGNFSDASIESIDGSGSSWLFVRTAKEGPVSREFIDAVFTAVESGSSEAESWNIPGEGHATRMLEDRPELITRITDWIADALSDLSG
jgi:dienelactone hydrolase